MRKTFLFLVSVMPIQAIFCINAGRSGSHYLAHLFEHVQDVESHHEPQPNMQGEAMVAWNDGNPEPLRQLLPVRIEQIAATNGRGNVWFSSNNAFIKGYGELLMERMDPKNVGVIFLTRNPHQIAESIIRKGWSVAAERDAPIKNNVWLLWPGMKRNLTSGPDHETPMSLALWYVEEVRQRGLGFLVRHRGIRYFFANVDDLNKPHRVHSMLRAFGLRHKDSLWQHVGKRTNTSA